MKQSQKKSHKALTDYVEHSEIGAAWKEVVESFHVLETALAKSIWLAGGPFSVGDFNVAVAPYRALLFVDVAKWPHVQAMRA